MPLDASRAYRTLGIGPGASSEDIKSAYHDLAQVWHPDRFPRGSRLHDKAEWNLKRINEAYALLKGHRPVPSYQQAIHVIGLNKVSRTRLSRGARWVIEVLALGVALLGLWKVQHASWPISFPW